MKNLLQKTVQVEKRKVIGLQMNGWEISCRKTNFQLSKTSKTSSFHTRQQIEYLANRRSGAPFTVSRPTILYRKTKKRGSIKEPARNQKRVRKRRSNGAGPDKCTPLDAKSGKVKSIGTIEIQIQDTLIDLFQSNDTSANTSDCEYRRLSVRNCTTEESIKRC